MKSLDSHLPGLSNNDDTCSRAADDQSREQYDSPSAYRRGDPSRSTQKHYHALECYTKMPKPSQLSSESYWSTAVDAVSDYCGLPQGRYPSAASALRLRAVNHRINETETPRTGANGLNSSYHRYRGTRSQGFQIPVAVAAEYLETRPEDCGRDEMDVRDK